MATDKHRACSQFHYQALGEHVQCYAVPVEYFSDVYLKEAHYRASAALKMNTALESYATELPAASAGGAVPMSAATAHAPGSALGDASQVALAAYTSTQQEGLQLAHDVQFSGSSLSATAKAQRSAEILDALGRIDHLLNPELDFAEVVEEVLLAAGEAVGGAERSCVYLIDRATETMRHYAAASAVGVAAAEGKADLRRNASLRAGATAAVSAATTSGSLSAPAPLSGVVQHVVRYAAQLNISDFPSSELYDPSVEQRAAGGGIGNGGGGGGDRGSTNIKRMKQVLFTPVFDAAGFVIAVLQLSNSKGKEPFTALDCCVAGIIASKFSLLRLTTVALPLFRPIHEVDDYFAFNLGNVITTKSNRHLRCAVQFYVGSQPYGPPFTTPSMATYPVSGGGDMRRCDFKQEVAMQNISLRNLPVAAKVVFTFESTNHHPVLWCGLHLFDYQRRLVQGELDLQMWDGGVPVDPSFIPALLQGLPYGHIDSQTATTGGESAALPSPPAMPRSGANASSTAKTSPHSLSAAVAGTLHIAFRHREETVLHVTPGVVKYSLNMGLHSPGANNPLPPDFSPTPVPLAAGASATEWYARQMTPSELGIYQALGKIVDVISPADIDSETSRLVWRLRNALCSECPWAMVWFVLCCDWTQRARVEESHRLLYSWAALSPLQAVQLLDGRFRDAKVRSFAANALDRLEEDEFQDIAFQLVYMLRFETHCDSALARLLLRRMLRSPATTGKQLLWYLHSAYLQEPIACAHHQRLIKLYLRSVADHMRARQGHGLYALQRIDTVYRGLVGSNLLPTAQLNARPSSPGRAAIVKAEQAQQAVTLLLAELNQNPWPSEFTVPAPVSGEQHSTGVVQCTKLPTIPHSFSFTLKYPDQNSTRLLYSCRGGVDTCAEVLFQQMLRAVDLIWRAEALQGLRAAAYDSFLLPSIAAGEAGGSAGASVVLNVPFKAKPIALLVAQANSGSGGFGGSGGGGMDSNPPSPSNRFSPSSQSQSIPDTLLADYFDHVDKAAMTAATADSTACGGGNRSASRANFISSLAG